MQVIHHGLFWESECCRAHHFSHVCVCVWRLKNIILHLCSAHHRVVCWFFSQVIPRHAHIMRWLLCVCLFPLWSLMVCRGADSRGTKAPRTGSTAAARLCASEPPCEQRETRCVPCASLAARESPSVIDGMCTQLDNKTRATHAEGNNISIAAHSVFGSMLWLIPKKFEHPFDDLEGLFQL